MDALPCVRNPSGRHAAHCSGREVPLQGQGGLAATASCQGDWCSRPGRHVWAVMVGELAGDVDSTEQRCEDAGCVPECAMAPWPESLWPLIAWITRSTSAPTGHGCQRPGCVPLQDAVLVKRNRRVARARRSRALLPLASSARRVRVMADMMRPEYNLYCHGMLRRALR